MSMPPDTPGPQPEYVAAFFHKHRTGLVTLVFTDLVDSTALLGQLGDQAGTSFMQRRRQIVRETLRAVPDSDEIETAGDSFLLVFSKPSDAVRFALQAQARLRTFSGQCGLEVHERIGIHLGEVVISERETSTKAKDLYGMQLTVCARLMSLAPGGQILLTRGVFDSARQVLKGEDLPGIGPLSWISYGAYQLKGVEEPVEVCEVGEVAHGPRAEPKTSDKGRRLQSTEIEPVLGWRPALGQEVPKTQWLLEKKLGEGGFGEVWLGRHQTMKERRVFKFCFKGERVRSLKREMTLFRVLKERVGDHPHIVRLLDVNFEEAPFYVVMDHVEGQDLRSWCEERGGPGCVPLATRLEIVAQIADALQAAHEAGVIHRDVKPGNILVARRAGADARPVEAGQSERTVAAETPPLAKLTDFGIGQVLSEEALKGVTKAGFTQTLVAESSSHTGSQMYMAPELLAGKPASTRADIYSLGVVLYQLLRGDLTQPLTTDWADHVADPLLRDDLRHCFAGNPHDRFPAAGQLAKNLRALSRRQSELARQQAELAAREEAAYRRGVLRTSALAAVIVITLAALAIAAWTQSRAAKATAAQLRINSYAADMKVVQVALAENNRRRAFELLRKYVPKQGEATAASQDDPRGLEWRYLWKLAQGDEAETLLRFDRHSRDALFSPTNPKLVATLSSQGEIKVLDLATRRTLLDLPPGEDNLVDKLGNGGSLMAFSPDGRRLAVSRGGPITIWDTDRWHEPPEKLDLEWFGQSLVFSPDGGLLAACVQGGVRLWNRESGRTNFLKTGLEGGWLSAAISPDGQILATTSCSASVQLWDLASQSRIGNLPDSEGCNPSLAFSPKMNLLAKGDWGGEVTLWDCLGQQTAPLNYGRPSRSRRRQTPGAN